MGKVLETRRADSTRRLTELRAALGEAEKLVGHDACVYVTGSFGRGEASEHSDLDAFIVGKTLGDEDGGGRALSRLDEICVKADLIKVSADQKFPPFDRDGAFLDHHTVDHLVKTLGKPEDDATNTFTARLLLLLESKPLLGSKVYDEIIGDVVAAYWRDYEDHRDDFVPAYLANDILRLWRTFCINYEARTQTDPPERKAKRKLKNYKLKHSRLLTCYSALAHLLAVYQASKTVSPHDVRAMVKRSPTERLEDLAAGDGDAAVKEHADSVIACYEQFLEQTGKPGHELVAEFMDPARSRVLFAQARQLGDRMFELMKAVGGGSKFYRLLVV